LTLEHHKYLVGFRDGTIRPGRTITRAEVATIFFRLLDNEFRTDMWSQQNNFSDVNLNDWYNNAISTLTNAELLSGRPDGTFAPNEPITRGEFVALAARFVAESDRPNEDSRSRIDLFDDTRDHWAEDYINTLRYLGWMQGDGGGNSFRPDDEITRAEVAAGINRMLGRLHEDEGGNRNLAVERMQEAEGQMRNWPDNRSRRAWYFLYIQEASHSTAFEWSECGEFVIWAEILPALDWTVLERASSRPGHISFD